MSRDKKQDSDWRLPDETPPTTGRFAQYLLAWLVIFVVLIGGAQLYQGWHHRTFPGEPSWIDKNTWSGRRQIAEWNAQQSPDSTTLNGKSTLEERGAMPEQLLADAKSLREMGEIAMALSLESYAASMSGDGQRAMTLIDEAVSLESNDPDLWSIHAEMAWNLERYDTAIASYRRAFALAPQRFDFRRRVAMVRADRGDHTGALTELNDILSASPNFAAARVRRAAMLLASGDTPGARADLDKLIADGIGVEDREIDVEGEAKQAEAYACRGMLKAILYGDRSALSDMEEAEKADRYIGEIRVAHYLAKRRFGFDPLDGVRPWDIDVDEVDGQVLIGNAIIKLYRNQIKPEELVRRLGTKNYFGRKMDVAAMHYYLGEWFALRDDRETARNHFRIASSEGAPYVCEYGLARLRLSELDG